MDLVVTKIKPDDKQSGKAISCQLYKARKKTKIDITEEEKFKNEVAAINPNMGIALIRDDVRKISRNIKPSLGGDRFAWFVAV